MLYGLAPNMPFGDNRPWWGKTWDWMKDHPSLSMFGGLVGGGLTAKALHPMYKFLSKNVHNMHGKLNPDPIAEAVHGVNIAGGKVPHPASYLTFDDLKKVFTNPK